MLLDKKSTNVIRGAIRLAFRRCDLHGQVMKNARFEVIEGSYKNGNDKVRVYYRCADCKEGFKPDMVEVDHIEEIGTFDGDWTKLVNRMWCDISNLQVLCKVCHKLKTKKYMGDKRDGEKYL